MPGKIQTLVELTVGGIYEYTAKTLESDKLAKRYFPVLMTIFLAVLAMNWFGLLPGIGALLYRDIPFLYPPATDLNITTAFAITAVFTVQLAGIITLGLFKYGGKFFNFLSPLKLCTGIIELISEVGRLISFSFRLFGNIFAGKVLLSVSLFFVPFVLPVPILGFELFVGFVQAAVFAFLTLVFIKLAVTEGH